MIYMHKLAQGIKKLRRFISDMDKVSLILTIGLFGFGLFSIVSASTREAVNNLDKSVYYYFGRQGKILLVCLAAYIFFLCVPTKNYRKYNYFFVKLAWAVVFGLNAYMIVQGTGVRGANNWIRIPGISFQLQPGEFAKPVLIVSLSLMLEASTRYFRNRKIKHWAGIGIFVIFGISTAMLIILQKDMGTASINLAIFLALFLSSPITLNEKFKTLICCIVVGIVGVLGLISIGKSPFTATQKARLTSFWNPCSIEKRNDEGYQICNAYIAMNLGGLTGVGIGKSTQKYSYIPEPHTDMIFSIIAEEDGFIVGTIIIICYMILITNILKLSSRATTISGKYICLGVATYIFCHIFLNLGGLFGLIPLTGVPLPFLSYGGSFALMLTISLAIVQRIHVETKRYHLKF